jgi:hypothetical protein
LPSYIAKTNYDWSIFLRENHITDNVNFWSPHPKPLIKALPGNHLFFLAKDPPKPGRKVLGFGTVREYHADTAKMRGRNSERETAQQVWKK